MRYIPVLLLALGLLGANVASADTISFQDGALLPGGGTYTGTQDTEIRGTDPATALGSAGLLRADLEDPNGGVDSEAQTLLRFDSIFGALPDAIPFGSTITSAVLTLSVTNSSNAPIGNISVYQMTSTWSEASTWNSMVSGVTIGSETVASADDTHTVEAIAITTFDVLPSLEAWVAGASNFGWVIVNDSNDGIQFHASDSATLAARPTLTVTFTPVPEPASLVLVGLTGAAALCVRRVRRSR
jgi:hypothetical protein